MNRDDDPQLWDLLGKTAAAEPSPFFARNVLRAIRQDEVRGRSFLSLRWLGPAAGVAAVLIAAALSIHQPAVRDAANTSGVIAKADLDDDVAADVDDLVGGDDDDSDVTSAIR